MVQKEYYRDYARMIQKGLEGIEKSEVSKHNLEKIKAFLRHLSANSITLPRQYLYIKFLKSIALWLNKPFEDATKDDIEGVLYQVNNYRKEDGTGYAESTIYDYRVVLKRFYKWVSGGEFYPDSVKPIKLGRSPIKNLKPEDMLDYTDLEKMEALTTDPMMKLLMHLLMEGGPRTNEFFTLHVNQVTFEKEFTNVHLIGKGVNGRVKERDIQLLQTTPYFIRWFNEHPERDSPDFKNSYLWVWVSKEGKVKLQSYENLCKRIKRLARKAGITKPVNFHNWRHGAAALDKKTPSMTDSLMRMKYGWTTAQMLEVYGRLSKDDMRNAIREKYGRAPENPDTFKPKASIECKRCRAESPTAHKFCGTCGFALNKKVVADIAQIHKLRDMAHERVIDRAGKVDTGLLKEAIKDMITSGELKL